jgi:hypothetical protein
MHPHAPAGMVRIPDVLSKIPENRNKGASSFALISTDIGAVGYPL